MRNPGLGKMLLEARKTRKASKAKVSRETGVNVETIRRIEAGYDSHFDTGSKLFKWIRDGYETKAKTK